MIKVRRGVHWKFDLNDVGRVIFRETDGLYKLIDVNHIEGKRPNEGCVMGPYDLTLQKMTPEEILVYEVMES